MRLIKLCAWTLLLAACEPSKQQTQQLFDSKQFFAQQIWLLNNQKTALQKHVWYNNLCDSLVISKGINWEKELRLFSEFDFAKPTNSKLFKVDTTYTENEINVTYRAIDNAQRIKHALIQLNKNYQIKAVAFSTSQKTNLFGSAQQLRYVVDSGFSINTEQQTQLAEDALYKIEGKFIQ